MASWESPGMSRRELTFWTPLVLSPNVLFFWVVLSWRMALLPLIFIGGKSQGSPCFLFSIILPSDLAVRTPDCISDTSLESICTTSALLRSLTCHLPPGLAGPSQLSYWTSTQLPLWPVFHTVVGSCSRARVFQVTDKMFSQALKSMQDQI